MALVLGAHVGDEFLIGNRRFHIEATDGESGVALIRDDGKKFTISGIRATEVLPDVYVAMGSATATWKLRLTFDAPRHVIILRRELTSKAG